MDYLVNLKGEYFYVGDSVKFNQNVEVRIIGSITDRNSWFSKDRREPAWIADNLILVERPTPTTTTGWDEP